MHINEHNINVIFLKDTPMKLKSNHWKRQYNRKTNVKETREGPIHGNAQNEKVSYLELSRVDVGRKKSIWKFGITHPQIEKKKCKKAFDKFWWF